MYSVISVLQCGIRNKKSCRKKKKKLHQVPYTRALFAWPTTVTICFAGAETVVNRESHLSAPGSHAPLMDPKQAVRFFTQCQNLINSAIDDRLLTPAPLPQFQNDGRRKSEEEWSVMEFYWLLW